MHFFISDEGNKTTIIDSTEQNLVAFRRTVYLIIQSSLDFQEAAHKLMKLDLKSGQDVNFHFYHFFLRSLTIFN